jgi:hypothetical protein
LGNELGVDFGERCLGSGVAGACEVEKVSGEGGHWCFIGFARTVGLLPCVWFEEWLFGGMDSKAFVLLFFTPLSVFLLVSKV